MATVNLKYSWFLNQKGTKRVKRMRLKYWKKWEKVNTIRSSGVSFGGSLSPNKRDSLMILH